MDRRPPTHPPIDALCSSLSAWGRDQGPRSLLLAMLFLLLGHASFLLQVRHAVATSVLFAPAGIMLAMAIRYGAGVWPGVFAGQLLLALTQGLPLLPSLLIGCSESLEAVVAAMLARRIGIDPGLPRAKDLGRLLLVVAFVTQPISATGGVLALCLGGSITDLREFGASWINWWIAGIIGQATVAPLLLVIFCGRRIPQLAEDLLASLAILIPAALVTNILSEHFGLATLGILFVPAIVLIAIRRGLAATSMGGILVAVAALYVTNRGMGPFFREGQHRILDLNVFVLGLTMTGQFLAVLLEQIRRQESVEQELREIRGRLERTAYELTENIPVGTYTMIQPPGGGMASFSFLSRRFLEMTGLEREEALSDPMKAFACVHPEDHGAWVLRNAHVFEHMIPFNESCRIIVRGEVRWITAESKPRRLPDGSVVWEGVLTDITDRKIAEQKLAKSEARLRTILRNIPVPLACNSLEKEPRITFLNEQFTRIFGYTMEDIPTLADWVQKAYPDEEYRNKAFTIWNQAVEKAALNQGAVKSMEFHVTCKDGSKRDVLISAVVMEEMLLACLLDITEKNKAAALEKRLEAEYRRKLEEKLRTSLTASAIAHEINQPLSTILLYSKMTLLNESGAREALAIIAGAARHVVSTIEKMKTLLRNVQTEHITVNLAQIVTSTLLYNKCMLARQNITVQQTGLDQSCPIMGDAAQLQLALTNLLRNSAEAIAGSGATKREISIHLMAQEDAVHLVLGDSGPGWKAAIPSEIPLTTTKPSGSGLGLFIVGTAMQNHGGTVTFGISPLGGAEVRLGFPKNRQSDR